jgi:hypothetical protein
MNLFVHQVSIITRANAGANASISADGTSANQLKVKPTINRTIPIHNVQLIPFLILILTVNESHLR